MVFTLQTRKRVKTRGGNAGYRENHYVRLSCKEGTVFYQNGSFYGANEGGDPIPDDDVPEWAKEHLASLNAQTRASVGAGGEPEPAAPTPYSRRGKKAAPDGEDD